MDQSVVLFERRDKVALLTINRPEVGNAVNSDVCDVLAAAWQKVRQDDAIQVAVLTGAGSRHFCTGADMRWQAGLSRAAEAGGVPYRHGGVRWPDIPADLWKPVIVAVNGVCAGGGLNFVAQGDFALCSEGASFLDPHVSIGWAPVKEALGMATKLPYGVAMRLALMGTSERLDAHRAYQLGLVTEVVPNEQLVPRALELAGRIASQAPLAVRAVKEVMRRTYGLEFAHEQTLAYASLLRTQVHRSPDSREGPRAFVEKRAPVWTGAVDPA